STKYITISLHNALPIWIKVRRDDITKVDENGNLTLPEFDVTIEVGFDAPMSRAYIEQMAMQLYQMGVINAVEVLKTMNFPNKERSEEHTSELQSRENLV